MAVRGATGGKRGGEDALVSEWTRVWQKYPGVVGVGDDCAVLNAFPENVCPVLKTDTVVERVHFRQADAPGQVGHKALARVLSDFGAMGATPTGAVVAVGMPEVREKSGAYMKAVYSGMEHLASEHGVALVGGELSKSKDFWLCVSGVGWVREGNYVERGGGGQGDILFVTGELGGSYPRKHLRFSPRVQEGKWLAENGYAKAMMDLSDGLGKDLPRMAKASGTSFYLDGSKIPRRRGKTVEEAVNDGEDYELLFAVSKERVRELMEVWPFAVRLYEIGYLLPEGVEAVYPVGKMRGYDHFR